VFESRLPSRIFGFKGEEVTGIWEKNFITTFTNKCYWYDKI
jgi:hypothetical protein